MNHDDLRAKALAATPGPWRAEGGSFDAVIDANEGDVADCLYSRDAAFIAAASPEVVLWLLDEIERLREILQQVEWEGGATCSVETPQAMCPWCGNTKEQGHSTVDDDDVRRDCALAANLRRQPPQHDHEEKR